MATPALIEALSKISNCTHCRDNPHVGGEIVIPPAQNFGAKDESDGETGYNTGLPDGIIIRPPTYNESPEDGFSGGRPGVVRAGTD